MHRSGTSVLTGALGLCGAWVGETSELTEANAENPRGFWERRDMRDICDRLLQSAGADWWKVGRFEPEAIPHAVLQEERARFSKIVSILDDHGTWVIKEPRLCLLLPLLQDCIVNPTCILIVRDPLEVARSLKARNGFGTSAGIALWEIYNRRALVVSKNLPRTLVSHEALMLRPAETLEGLVERLAELGATGLKIPRSNFLGQLIEPSLYRRRASAEELPEFLSPSQLALWQAFRNGGVPEPGDGTATSPAARQHLFDLESAQLSLQRHSDRARELSGTLATSNRTISELRSEAATLTAEATERRAAASVLETTIATHEATIEARQETIATQEAMIEARQETIATHEATIEACQETIATQEATIEACQETIATREATIEARQETIATHEATIEACQETIKAHLAANTDLKNCIASLTADRDERQAAATALEATIKARDDTIRALLNSTSWKVTGPLRAVSRASRRSLRTLSRGLRASRRLGIGRTTRVAHPLRLAPGRPRASAASSVSASPTDAASSVSRLIRASRLQNSTAGQVEWDTHADKKRLKISVIAWDLAHNPLGRAYLIADVLRNDCDVEIVGSIFPDFGSDIWKPLRHCSRVPIRSIPGEDFPRYFRRMQALARQIDADVLVVSKPRLPSLGLAILAKTIRNRPIVLDIDDSELSFFGNCEPLGIGELQDGRDLFDIDVPYGEAWTRLCETLVPHVDLLTVSNEELRKKYGGLLLPHIRDERDFDPALFPRDAIRRALGFRPDDNVILFAGTPRMHKGLSQLVAALKELDRPTYKLLVVGSPADGAIDSVLRRADPNRVTLLADVPFSDLPGYLCAADLIALLQDDESPTSEFQIPAKFTDALSMGIPVLASNVPPLVTLANGGLVELLSHVSPAQKIDEIFSNYNERKERALRNRRAFEEDYSYAAHLSTLRELMQRQSSRPKPVAKAFRDLVAYQRSCFGADESCLATSSQVYWPQDPIVSQQRTGPGSTQRRVVRAGRRADRSYVDSQLDIVFFWKQNDSGIYGRRQDMFVKYLARDPRVNRIFHFDAPVDIFRSIGTASRAALAGRYSHAQLVARQTLRRRLGLANKDKVMCDTFVYAGGHHRRRLLRCLLPTEGDHLSFVRRLFERHQIGKRRTVFWVCPVSFDFPAIEKGLGADLVVADVIDDERQWPVCDAYKNKLNDNYEEILKLSDLVLTNCQSLRESMSTHSNNIHLVPNAVELLAEESRAWRKPRELRRLAGPVIGYAGNLDVARLDLKLLAGLASERPDWNFLFIGSMHKGDEIRELEAYGNVHFLGVRAYEQALRYIRHFDVAIIPHLDNALTQSMNPLKLYVYHALLVPVVSTPVANIGDFATYVRIGQTPQDFVGAIDDCLRHNPLSSDLPRLRALLRENSWPERVKCVLNLIGQKLELPREVLSPANQVSRLKTPECRATECAAH